MVWGSFNISFYILSGGLIILSPIWWFSLVRKNSSEINEELWMCKNTIIIEDSQEGGAKEPM